MKITIVKPRTMLGRNCVGKMRGTGMGSVLLHGSAGVASTYTSDAPGVPMTGSGLGKTISAKLGQLKIQSKKKPENIKFSI